MKKKTLGTRIATLYPSVFLFCKKKLHREILVSCDMAGNNTEEVEVSILQLFVI